MTHALPPKPVTASVPYVPPSDPSIVEATAMAVRPKKPDATPTVTPATPNLKNGSRHDHIGPLPVPWEVCIPRSGNGIYYHNSQTGQTQWDRPVSSFHLDVALPTLRLSTIPDIFSPSPPPQLHLQLPLFLMMIAITGQVMIDIRRTGVITRVPLPVLPPEVVLVLGLFLLPLPMLVEILALVEIINVRQGDVLTLKTMSLRGNLLLRIYPRLTTDTGFLPHHLPVIRQEAGEGSGAKITQ